MKRFMGTLTFALTVLTGTASHAQDAIRAAADKAAIANTALDTVDVQHVIDSYHEAVVTHNASRLSQLFLAQGSTWLNVLSDEAYAREKAKSPTAVKVRVGSYTDFAKLLSTAKASFNPIHTHMQVKSDGTIVSVYFDFSFLVDGKEQNRGSETWVLVQWSDGWRTAAITYSSDPKVS